MSTAVKRLATLATINATVPYGHSTTSFILPTPDLNTW